MIRNAVALSPCTEEDIVFLNAMQVKPFQQVYCDLPSKVFAQKKEGVSHHVVKKDGVPVGMFSVDSRYHLGFNFANFDTLGISNFLIDDESQGKGFGTEVCRMMPVYLRGLAPRARGSYMLVMVNNAGAHKAFIRGGWTNTGEKFTLGLKGVQNILWLPM
ncbi:GNAT family N-acetyltransferase [uncultured Paraglaciecola sp.]|uniref:GNAT family N-acetyltransferase n=1 Tax=uncultured Paraglaciecola sp. TaxID=1765024 RepID=UPI0030D98792|tara:strand:- start:436080 stop:436559 length:480 start_codon:yes stop_codon:yes gene_type:complete